MASLGFQGDAEQLKFLGVDIRVYNMFAGEGFHFDLVNLDAVACFGSIAAQGKEVGSWLKETPNGTGSVGLAEVGGIVERAIAAAKLALETA